MFRSILPILLSLPSNQQLRHLHTGEIYKHYKTGTLYEVIAPSARLSEDPLVEYTVYKALYNSPQFGESSIWVRPRIMFEGSIVMDGKTFKRFSLEQKPTSQNKPDNNKQ